MSPAAFPTAVATLLFVVSRVSSVSPAAAWPDQNLVPGGERVESGSVESPGGAILHYRIRLLPPTSFPALPQPVADQLSRRQCMIPQTFEAQQPENVIQGQFRGPGSHDWAALCSSSGSTTLYVFFGGQFDAPVALRSQSDSSWLGAEPASSVYGSAWGIATLPAAEIRSSPQLRHAALIDHDAIDDAHLEHSHIIRYHQAGKWLTLNSSNAE